MRSWHLGIVGAIVVALTACGQKQQQPAYEPKPYEPLAQMDAPPADTGAPEERDPYATDPMVEPRETRTAEDRFVEPPAAKEEPVIVRDAGGVRTHIVAKNDSLYKLARQYYNDQSKWKVIWEANKARLPNPDRLTPGMQLIIP